MLSTPALAALAVLATLAEVAGARAQEALDAPVGPPTVTTFATLPTGNAIENLCQSPDGTIYVTVIDQHKVLKVTTDGTVSEFADPPGAVHVLGIACPTDNEIAVVVYNKAFRRTDPASGTERLDFSDTASRIVIFNAAGRTTGEIAVAANVALNGIAGSGDGIYYAADSNSGAVYRIDVAEKRAEAWFKHDGSGPTRSAPIGVNGIKIKQGWVHFSSTAAMDIYRIWVAPDGKPRGFLATIHEGLPVDDFDVAQNGDVYFPVGPVLYRVAATGGEAIRFVAPIPPGPAALVSADGQWVYWPTNEAGAANQRIMRAAIP